MVNLNNAGFEFLERNNMATIEEIRKRLITMQQTKTTQRVDIKRCYYFGLFLPDVSKGNREAFEKDFANRCPTALCLLHSSRKEATRELQAMLTDLYNFEGARVKKVRTNSEYGRYNILTESADEATIIKLTYSDDIVVQLEIPEDVELLLKYHRKIKETDKMFSQTLTESEQMSFWEVKFLIRAYYKVQWLEHSHQYIMFKSSQDDDYFACFIESERDEYNQSRVLASSRATKETIPLIPGKL